MANPCEPALVFLVNGGPESAMGYRARAFQHHLASAFPLEIAYRTPHKILSITSFHRFLHRRKPGLVYVLDAAYSGVLAAALYRSLHRPRVIVDTGDAIYELMRSSGARGPLGLAMTRALEELTFRLADRMVVRGTRHRDLLRQRGIEACLVPDGVDTEVFRPIPVPDLRRRLHVDGALTVGVVGASIWSDKLDMGYGWELVELLRFLPGSRVKGIFIGDGSGVARLKERAERYGLGDRIQFVGRVPMEELPSYLNSIDICLSTQTANLAGEVRTTGKLPQYMATGRYILASRVGEAALVLPDEMLVDYSGVKDQAYPQRLAERVTSLLDHPGRLAEGLTNVPRARAHFEYRLLAQRLEVMFREMLAPK